MKSKVAILCLALMAGLTLTLTACGSADTESASSAIETIASTETSETLGLYLQDTDGDGTFDTVVDQYGVALGEQYHIEADGVYKDKTLLIAIENAQVYIPVEEIAFTIESRTVHPGTEFTLELVILPEDATCMEYDLTVDNADILQIENDTITTLADGEATVTATAKAGGATATCLIIVNTEVEETEEQNEQAIASGGAINNSNNNTNNSGSAIETSGNRNTNTGSNNNTTVNTPVNNNTSGNSNTNTGNNNVQTPATPVTPQPQVHAPIRENRWVVDQAAWSEEVIVWGNKEIAVCNNCGADISGNAAAHGKEHALKGEPGGHHSEVIKIQTGTRIIVHPEEGHWESVLVCNGCTGTH